MSDEQNEVQDVVDDSTPAETQDDSEAIAVLEGIDSAEQEQDTKKEAPPEEDAADTDAGGNDDSPPDEEPSVLTKRQKSGLKLLGISDSDAKKLDPKLLQTIAENAGKARSDMTRLSQGKDAKHGYIEPSTSSTESPLEVEAVTGDKVLEMLGEDEFDANYDGVAEKFNDIQGKLQAVGEENQQLRQQLQDIENQRVADELDGLFGGLNKKDFKCFGDGNMSSIEDKEVIDLRNQVVTSAYGFQDAHFERTGKTLSLSDAFQKALIDIVPDVINTSQSRKAKAKASRTNKGSIQPPTTVLQTPSTAGDAEAEKVLDSFGFTAQ